MKIKNYLLKLIISLISIFLMSNCEDIFPEKETIPIEKKIFFNPSITYDSLVDIDGNTYKTVIIGTQTWMAENLKVAKYNDGTNIKNIKDNEEWSKIKIGAFCDYHNIPSISITYGKLYNGFAVNTGKLCPTGWHVSTFAEWTTLINFLDGDSIAGGKLKETDTSHWQNINVGATNELGFTALPGGERYIDGQFVGIGRKDYKWSSIGSWWSPSEDYKNSSHSIQNSYSSINAYFGEPNSGLSVRCVKN